jgi:hypothetical protein
MKRLTPRFKNWLWHRRRNALRQRNLRAGRFARSLATQGMVKIYEAIQKLTRRLAQRDSLYVIWAYAQRLQTADFSLPQDIEVAPQFLAAKHARTILSEWTLEQITREVIQHAPESPSSGRSLRQWATLAQMANALRDLEGEIYKRLIGGEKLHLELMRTSHRQFTWQSQRPNAAIAIRYYKLFNTPAIDLLCKKETSLDLKQLYVIGMCYLGLF